MTTLLPISDDDLRDALGREPSSGLAWLVADAVASEIARTPQQRTMRSIAAWLLPADRALSPWTRRAVLMTALICLVAGTAIAAALVGALLRHPTPLRNGAIAVAPPEGGVVLIGGEGRGTDGTPAPGTSLAWSPDGDRLAFWSGAAADPASNLQGYAWQLAILDAGTGSIERPMREGLPRALEPNGPIQWSADGRRILAGVLADGSPTVLVADPATGRFSRLGAPDTDTTVAAWSPDGLRLAFVAAPRFTNDWRLYLAATDGADARAVPLELPPDVGLSGAGALGGLAMQMGFPLAWSPDGRRILVTASSETGATTTFVVGVADGSAAALTPAGANPLLARWSPDGSSVAFLAFDPRRLANDLYVIAADGTGIRRLVEDVCGLLEWAPDGSELLFDTGLCDRADTIAVGTVRPDGSGVRTVWSEPRPVGLPPLLATSASVDANGGVSASWQGIRP
jgi:hypothetical protein